MSVTISASDDRRNRMITTVTANPALDRTLYLTSLTPGAVHRAQHAMVEPSGKGVNVALALKTAGQEVTAVLPVGGSSGPELVAMLDAAGLIHRDVPIAGTVRSNISLIEADGTTTKVNEPGPRLSPTEVNGLIVAALEVSSVGEWLAWCGSLPAGFHETTLAAALAEARSAGRLVALDSSGTALATVLSRRPADLPHLVKPNADELAEVTGRPLRTLGDVADAAALLVERGVETVLVSLGGDGAILINDQCALHGEAPVEKVVNTAGAGDGFLAGYLAAVQQPADQRLMSALRFGAAAVRHHGTLFSDADLNQPVYLRSLDPTRPLHTSAH
jgi:1-phosphofructokinase